MSRHYYNLERDKKDDRDYKVSFEKAVKISTNMDLRSKLPEIFDQGELGSCTANAGVAARMVLNDIDTVLSRLFLYYKERELEGTVSEDSGASMRDICKALNKYGVCEENFMPYNIDKFTDTPSEQALSNAVNYKIAAYKRLVSLNEIKRYIASNEQGVLMGISVYESFESDDVAATGKVPVPDIISEQYLGGHAIYVVGYKDETNNSMDKCLFRKWIMRFSKKANTAKSKGYLICRNSWGSEWGDKGYFYLPYEFVEEGFAYDFWVVE